MTKKITDKLKSYTIVPDEENRIKTIVIGKKIITQKAQNERPYFNLLRSTFRFISPKTWIMQFLLLLLTIGIHYSEILAHYSLATIINSYLLIFIFSTLFFLDELYRSFTTGMWELEQSFKFDLRQHTLMKLLIFGFFDFLLILMIAILSKLTMALPIVNVLLYLLVPYNLVCILLLYTITFWRNNMKRIVLWSFAGILSSASLILTNLLNIYKIELVYWFVAFLLTSCLLLYFLYKNNKEELKKWS